MLSRIKLGNIRFGMRLALLAGIMILIISVISITCVITMSKMNQDFQRAYVNNTSGLVALSSVTDTIHRVRIRAFDAALARDKDGAKQCNISEIVGGSVRLMLGMRPVVGHPIC